MNYTLDELTTPLTVAEIKASIYSTIAATGTDHTSWKTGAVIRVLITGVSIILAALSQLVASIARSGFLDLADDSWVSLVVRYVYGITRESATFATGYFTLTNTAGGVFELDPDDMLVTNEFGISYRNRDAISLAALETLEDQVFVCVVAGSDGSMPADTTLTVESPSMTGVNVTNPAAFVGLDQETRAAAVTRARAQLAARSPNGPYDAYYVAARQAVRTDGTSVGITRVSPPLADGEGGLTVYVATAAGAVTGDVNDPETDLGAVSLAVQRQAVPLGVTADVLSASTLAINVVAELWLTDDGSIVDAEVEGSAQDLLETDLAAEPIGGTDSLVYHSTLEGLLFRSDPRAFRISLTTPAANTAVAEDEAPALGTLDLTINKVRR